MQKDNSFLIFKNVLILCLHINLALPKKEKNAKIGAKYNYKNVKHNRTTTTKNLNFEGMNL